METQKLKINAQLCFSGTLFSIWKVTERYFGVTTKDTRWHPIATISGSTQHQEISVLLVTYIQLKLH